MEIILHVGMGKTGTSSIQKTLLDDDNSKLLKKSKYVCLPTDFKEMCHLGRYFSRSKLWQDYCEFSNESTAEIEELKNDLFLELKSAGQSGFNAIISSETLHILSMIELDELKDFFNQLPFEVSFKIVFCVRERVAQTVSFIQQSIRSDYAHLDILEDFLCFKKQIQSFIEVFGRENIILYSFEEARKDDLVHTFFRKIKLPEDIVQSIKSYNVNEASSQLAIELSDYIRLSVPRFINGHRNERRKYYNREKFFDISGVKFNVTVSEAEEIYQKNLVDINWLNETFGIDYRKPDLSKYPQKISDEMTQQQIEEVKEIFMESNILEKEVILGFLNNKRNTEQVNSYDELIELLENNLSRTIESIKINTEQVLLWGVGWNSDLALEICKKLNVEPQAFIDSDVSKVGRMKEGLQIISRDDFYKQYSKSTAIFVTVKSKNIYNEIERELNEKGYFNVRHLM